MSDFFDYNSLASSSSAHSPNRRSRNTSGRANHGQSSSGSRGNNQNRGRGRGNRGRARNSQTFIHDTDQQGAVSRRGQRGQRGRARGERVNRPRAAGPGINQTTVHVGPRDFVCITNHQTIRPGWIPCKVPSSMGEPNDSHIFLTPTVTLPGDFIQNKDVFVRHDAISPQLTFLLPISDGDKFEVLLSDNPRNCDKTPAGIKPSAYKSALLAYSASRSLDDLQNYFSNCSKWLNDSKSCSDAANSIISCDPLWDFIWHVKCDDSESYEDFKGLALQFVFDVARHMKTCPSKLKNKVDQLINSKYIDSVQQNKSMMVIQLANLVVDIDATLLKDVMPLLSTVLVDPQANHLVKDIYDLIQKLGNISDFSDWKALKSLPSTEEILGGPFLQNQYLSSVILGTPYSSTEDYLSTYYRLLRTECFHAIQKGIEDFVSGKLDSRDMHVYKNVKFKGVKLVNTKVVVQLNFKLDDKVTNWKASRKLMFGNLLCITINDDFSDCIWMTVSDRNAELLEKHSIIGAELVTFNESDSNHALTLNKLLVNSGKMTMVESPTYFQSFKYVLSSLKYSELDKYSLLDDIVHGKFSEHEGSRKYNWTDNGHTKAAKVGELEDHQLKAFYHAFRSRLGIIQGPPGTGKTFVGAKLARILVSLQDNDQLKLLLGENNESDQTEKPPILILTYKNHALDEFLKHCTKFCSKDFITRLGSQSKEKDLEQCLIHQKLINNTRAVPMKPVKAIVTEIENKFKELSQFVKQFKELQNFTFSGFLKQMTPDQIKHFVVKAFAVQLKKPTNLPTKLRGVKVTAQMVESMFNLQGDPFKSQLIDALNINNQESSPQLLYLALKLNDVFEKFWLPNRQTLLNLTELNRKGAAFFNPSDSSQDVEEDEEYDVEADYVSAFNVNEFDEDYINEQSYFRTSAMDFGENLSINDFFDYSAIDKATRGSGTFSVLDFPRTCNVNHGLYSTANLWDLTDIEKYAYIYSFLTIGLAEVVKNVNDTFESIGILQQKKKGIDEQNRVQLLKTQKIVGATIVGASIQLSLLQKLNPKVVIVEEAAEVLESCLVAVLGKSVQKLILIGDHMQLKPQVDTYYLRREHNFHISMMERLIKLNFPFKSLVKQGRMRTEFSKMLKDIYPDYDNFDDLNNKNKPLNCVPKSMFFWSHNFEERKDRSVTNEKEANMVVALALYFISSGVEEEDLTILCGYLGQVQLVKKLLKSYFDNKHGGKKPLIVKTIDEYQGDENEYVIISLTRSNRNKSLGFMKEKERRCVAQSRAKCGMYFVGNFDMFKNDKTWKPVTSIMEREGCVGHEFPLHCYKHPSVVHHVIQSQDILDKATPDKKQLMNYVHSNNNWCNMKCNTLFECKIELHRCKKPCTPRHDDTKCKTMVLFQFPVCGHSTNKECHSPEKDMKCQVKINATLQCSHVKEVPCHEWYHQRSTVKCKERCLGSYSCKAGHACGKVCGDSHNHKAEHCRELVPFDIPGCGHKAAALKVCGGEVPTDVVCYSNVKFVCEKCKHPQSRVCREKEKCMQKCTQKRPDCGHSCSQLCHVNCLEDTCLICRIEYLRAINAAKNRAKKELEELKKAAASDAHFELAPLLAGLEYNKVEEKCQMIFNLYASCNIKLVNVWKIQCPSVYTTRFLERSYKAFGPYKEELYHINSGLVVKESVKSAEDLFNMVRSNSGEFRFVKFASKNKSTSKEMTITVTEVITGDCINSTELSKSQQNSMLATLKDAKKDSVIESLSNVSPAAYKVYDKDQIKLLYVVNLHAEDKPLEQITRTTDYFKDHKDEMEHVFDLSTIDLRDVSDPLVEILQKAISLYRGGCSKRSSLNQNRQPMQEIKSIGVTINRRVDGQYEAAKAALANNKFTEVFAYHATAPGNIASIVKTNLDPNRRAAHGRAYGDGCYFSEHPEFSFSYGSETMFIFKVLLIEGQYTMVAPDAGGFCQQLVLKNAAHFKPVYVLRF